MHNFDLFFPSRTFTSEIAFKYSPSKCLFIVMRNGNVVCKHWPYCCYFCLNLTFLVDHTGSTSNRFCGEDFDVVLAILCSYDEYASEAADKIATHKKRWSQILLVRYNLHDDINHSRKKRLSVQEHNHCI